MIRCTRHLMQILVAFLLTGCAAPTPRTAGPQFADASVGSAASATATEMMSPPTRVALATLTPTASPTGLPTATALPTARPTQPAPTSTAAPTSTPAPTMTATSATTATPDAPAVAVAAGANVRAGPGTAYQIIAGAGVGQRLPVTGQHGDWWQVEFSGRIGWIWGALVTPNAAAQQAPQVGKLPAVPTAEAQAEAKAEPTAASTSTSTSASSLPDLVVLGPETQYPVRARVVRGWDYEFVDLSTQYDIVVYRDVFGMLTHQIDDENIRRYYRNKPRLGANGPVRITLVDAQPHPDGRCPGWGWVPDHKTYAGSPFGGPQNPCLVQHSLRPGGDGHGAVLLTGWSFSAGNTVAVAAYGPTGADWSTTYFAELIVWPARLGPADRPDFTLPLYRPLGQADKVDGRWVWQVAFVQIVPAGR